MRVVEHIEYRVDDSQHEAFVAAFAEVRSRRLAARGCRSVELTRGSENRNEYRVRIEWRSAADRTAFGTSHADADADLGMAAFQRHAHHIDTPIVAPRNEVEHDPLALRQAFGHYPTGVAAITAMSPDGPVGMLVSSFTTVSLKPALVAFCAAHTSTTWPFIADARSCCINLLEASQEDVCRQLSAKREQRFASLVWSPAPSGAPVITGVVGWLDCVIDEVRVAGDHDFVLLSVLTHHASPDREPLLFHRSGYRSFPSRVNDPKT